MDCHLFKVWSRNRDIKKLVVVHETEDILNKLILKASEKLNIDGSILVLEGDGTPIDEDAILILLKKETLILLTNEEKWVSDTYDTSSNASTNTTILSNSSKQQSDDTFTSPAFLDTTLTNNIDNFENVDVNSMSIIFDTNLEYIWSNFQIPWGKIPAHIIAACEENRADKQAITQILHSIIYEMRQIKTNIPFKAFRYVAKQLTDKFPRTFRDIDSDGYVIGDGTHSLIMKLSDRNHYLNRPHKRNVIHPTAASPRTVKKRLNKEAGCSNWDPPILNKVPLSDVERLNSHNIEDNDYYSLLEKTFPEQRQYLNNTEKPPSVNDIKMTWPVLFRKSAIVWHFQKLTGVDLDEFERSLQIKAEKIVNHAIQKKVLSEAVPERQSELCIEFYAKSFKEDLSYFYYHIENSHEKPISTFLMTTAPCIVKFDSDERWDVIIEKEVITSCTSFAEALKYTFALYFNLNLEYPRQVGATLEMIQRFHLKIHPATGSKSSSTKKKVLNLMNRLKNIK